MAKKKLVSVRIDQRLVEFIDERVIGRYVLSRSGAIEAALRMVFQQLSDEDIMNAFRSHYSRSGATVVTLREFRYVGGGHFMICDPEKGLVEF